MEAKEKARLIFNAAQIDGSDVYALRGNEKIYVCTAFVDDGRTIGVSKTSEGVQIVDVTEDDVYRVDPELLYGKEESENNESEAEG